MKKHQFLSVILILVIVCSVCAIPAYADGEAADTDSARNGWDIVDLIVLVACVGLGGAALYKTTKKKPGNQKRRK